MKKGMKSGNSKVSYDTLYIMISPKPNSREQLSSNNNDSKLITDKDGVLMRWA